uniref:Short-chain collagen C4-like n=1 Tax=Crassostrea virginica TaxID=6565 RepID=A0A8B8AQY8_CRAVI|nr:short-chain collagen C4-like [Crassostrea virginica]
MLSYFLLLMIFAQIRAETNTGNCKDMLQGYLTGQLSSALGVYQVEALRREFKSFTEIIEKSIKELKENVKKDLNSKDSRNSSVVYTRWGKKTCHSNAELVFSGFAGGSYHANSGGAVDPLCLPRDPEWGMYRDGTDGFKSYIYGAEYQTHKFNDYLSSFHDHDIPCAVCLVRNRSVVKMFPARKTCFNGWNLEYRGYLMAGYYAHPAGSMFTCIDGHPDTLHGGQANVDGKLFYPVEARCGPLKCPPYVEGRELICAVCSKE